MPVFESHDPSMLWDPVSEAYYSYSTDTSITSKREIGIPVRRSRDLVSFEYVGLALSEKAVQEGRDNGAFAPTAAFWAPYVEYCREQEEYRMYYSATKAFGSSESRIWLAAARHPEGPFENRGIVADTWNTSDALPNAIDPHVINDREGRKYLVYGSFFGGIFMKELDVRTGLPLDGNGRTLGSCIAKKPKSSPIDGPEGAAVIYCPETDYFYLFLSYGWLGDGYDIRVSRSRCVLGPYRDFNGQNMMEETLGTKLAGSYCFEAENPNAYENPVSGWSWGGFRGPGHGVPFYAPAMNKYFFVHHIRDGSPSLERSYGGRKSYHAHYMMIREMEFVNGWPVFSPEPYSGEENAQKAKAPEEKSAVWESIVFAPMDNDQRHSEKICWHCRGIDENGDWILQEDERTVRARLFAGWDFENAREGLFFSGLTEEGIAVWGKALVSEEKGRK